MSFLETVLRLAQPWLDGCYPAELEDHLVLTMSLFTQYSARDCRAGVRAILQSQLRMRGTQSLESRGLQPIAGEDLRLLCLWPDLIVPETAMAASELVNHCYDVERISGKYKKRLANLRRIQAIPQHEQKSMEWLEQRKGCLTATAVSIALNEDKYKYPFELFLDKCGRGPEFIDNANVHHGRKYEEIGTLLYGYRYNVVVGEYGLIQHDRYPFIGASPDGICHADTPDYTGYNKLVGRLLEIKFPRTRKIQTKGELNGELCPHYYYRQVETQLFSLHAEECDFLQCQIEEYDSYREWLLDTHPTMAGLSAETYLEKGCIIQLLPKDTSGTAEQRVWKSQYLYPPRLHMTPAETEVWIGQTLRDFPSHRYAEDYVYDKVIYWRLGQVSCHLITLPEDWEEENVPLLRQYWDYITWAREDETKLDRILERLKGYSHDQTKEIFATIHQMWVEDGGDRKLKPLYTESNEWRDKIERQKAYWKRK